MSSLTVVPGCGTLLEEGRVKEATGMLVGPVKVEALGVAQFVVNFHSLTLVFEP